MNRKILTLAMLGCLSLLLNASAQAGTAEWTGGLPEGGYVTSVAHDPTSSGRVLAAPSLGGAYRSQDGGLTWSPSRSGLTLESFDLLVGSDGVVYALANRCCFEVAVFRSPDGGASWQEVSPGTADYSNGRAIDPSDSDIAYFTTQSSGVFRTVDGGASWVPINNGLPNPPPYLEAIAVDPTDPDVLYLSTSGDLYRSSDRGASWSQITTTFVRRFSSLAVDPLDPSRLLGASLSGTFRSTDGGVTWDEVEDTRSLSAAIHPTVAGLYLIGTEWTILRSTDGGDSWTDTSPTEPLGRVAGFSFDPFGSSDVMAAGAIGPLRSTSTGASWTRQVNGMDAYVASSVASPPADPTKVVTADGSGPGIFRSSNSGGAWSRVDETYDPYPVKGAPSDPSRFYGVVTFSPILPFGWLSDIVRSDDGGQTWQTAIVDASAFGSSGPLVFDLAVHPENAAIVVALNYSFNFGFEQLPPAILRSPDGGASWQPLYRPDISEYYEAFPMGVGIDPDDPARMFVGVQRTPNSGPGESLILRTLDGGHTWTEAPLGSYTLLTSIAFDAGSSSTVYATGVDQTNRVDVFLKTTDGGQSWNEIPHPFVCMNHVAADPDRPGHLYASCYKVHRSLDGGQSWDALDGESFPLVRTVNWLSVSSTVPRVVHAGTSGGVYSNTTGVMLSASGSCPGIVTLQVSNAPPNSEIAVLAAANDNGWVKGGTLCNGASFEIGEPFRLPPTLVKVGVDGNGSTHTELPANRCWVEAMSFANCTTSGAVLAE